jgi:integrase
VQVLAIIKATPQRDSRDLVFGSGDGGYSGWSKAKAALDEKIGKGAADWTLHDLHRTSATRMADSGMQPHIIEAVLYHVSGHKGGVAGGRLRTGEADSPRLAQQLH